jgi:membrane protease YdiL (CAAX protease family)
MSDTVPTTLAGVALTAAGWLLMWFVFAVVVSLGGATTLGLALGVTLGFGAVGSVVDRSVPDPSAERIGLRGFSPRWAGMQLLLLPAVILTSELDNLTQWVLPPSELEEALEDDAVSSVLQTLEWMIFSVLLRPVVEEFFFRGVVQQGLAAQLGRLRGVLLTALLFALVRASLGLGSPYGAYLVVSLGAQALFEGVLFGVARLATGSILASILLHAGIAAIGGFGVLMSDLLPIPGFNSEGAHSPLALVVPCALSVALGLRLALSALRR